MLASEIDSGYNLPILFFHSECKDALPFCLIFGIATTVDSIHRLLPHGTTSKLAIDSFTSTPSIHLLAKFIESIVMDSSIYFQLGGKVLKILLETFSFHDLSVRHFLMALKFCVLNHFASNEMSVFCCQLPKRTEAFGLVGKKMIREYNDLEGTLKSMDRKTSRFNLVVAALHSIVHNLPKQPLGKNVRKVFIAYLILRVLALEYLSKKRVRFIPYCFPSLPVSSRL